jgi:tyrosinase
VQRPGGLPSSFGIPSNLVRIRRNTVDHSRPSDGHSPPKTFDEVIARGFPLDELEELAKAHAARRRGRPAPRAGRLLRATAAVVTTHRKDQASLSPAEQTAFQNAVVQLVEEGKYLELIQDHMDMSHNMHGTMGEVGLYRFLAWHRRYLVEIERELQRVDALLRPGAPEKLGIPYWRWQDAFPAWLADFLPAQDPETGQTPPARKNSPPPAKANADDIDIIVNQFSIQSTGLSGENDYTKFTYGVEGWGLRADGTGLPAHNHGHSWIGGIMNNTSTSPTDPIFWLHHAEVDRLWQIWRQTNPTPAPLLAGADRIMDPWAESYDDLLDTAALGYTYDSMSL